MKKISFVMILCTMLLCACSAPGQKENPSSVSDSTVLLSEQDLMERNTEDVRDFALQQSDADQLISEKLEGTDCTFTADGTIEIGGNHYYIYQIQKDGKKIQQGLAVEDLSGEILTYDFESESVSGYEEFEYYDAEKDEQVLWDGTFYFEDSFITLLPADPSSSEIHVNVDGKEVFAGMICPEGNTAILKEKDFTVQFVMDGQDLLVEDKEGKSGFSGTYVLE